LVQLQRERGLQLRAWNCSSDFLFKDLSFLSIADQVEGICWEKVIRPYAFNEKGE